MAPVPGGVVTRTSLPHLHSPSARSVPEGGPAAGRWWPRARGAIGPAGPGHGSRGQKGGWGDARGGLWEGAEPRRPPHLGSGVSRSCHLQMALSVDEAAAQMRTDKDEKGAGLGPTRGRAAGEEPGGGALETEGVPRERWGGSGHGPSHEAWGVAPARGGQGWRPAQAAWGSASSRVCPRRVPN